MPYFTCPKCQAKVPIRKDTQTCRYFSFDSSYPTDCFYDTKESIIELVMRKCSGCDFETIHIKGRTSEFSDLYCLVHPRSTAKQFPDYVPKAIRSDYEEACAILTLSPKASATLSRRCLQGIIQDFYGITKGRLKDQIDGIRDKVTPSLWSAIDGLRKLGNIGAHMEKDVNTIIEIDAGEAEKLIKLIERLIESTYLQKRADEELFLEIESIAGSKKKTKKSSEQTA